MDDDTRARILRLHASGVPSSHIARRLGVPRRVVNKVLRDAAKERAR